MASSHSSEGLPGFRLTSTVAIAYLSVMVLVPFVLLFGKALSAGPAKMLMLIQTPRVQAAVWLTVKLSAAAALANLIIGTLIAWVLVRYRFPGRRLVDALIDIPFALPTAVAGIALTNLYAPNGILGAQLMRLGIRVAYAPLGIFIALVFVGFPFVVRSVQPVLQDMNASLEEAAATMGAHPWQIFRSVIFPVIRPAMLTGFSLALARSLGEYGSVVFISGNMPFRTEVVPLLIMSELEQYDYAGAAIVAVGMLGLATVLLVFLTQIQQRLVAR